jgi:hypothetical protein
MRTVDRVFGWLLVLGALAHAVGAWSGSPTFSTTLVWALSGALAALLVAAINLLRVDRPHDRPLGVVCLFGCIGWMAVALGIGKSIANFLDARVVINTLNGAVLGAFSLRTIIEATKATRPRASSSVPSGVTAQ